MSTSQFVGKSAPSTVEYVASISTGVVNPGQATLNWNSAGIGTAAADRVVFVVLVGTTRTLTSATIGGIGATIHSAVADGITIFSALVPTGTTANIVMNFSGSSAQNFRAFTLRATGLVSATPQDTWSQNGTYAAPGVTLNRSVSCDTGGIMVGGFMASGDSVGFSGITGQNFSDNPHRAALRQEVAAGGTQAFTITVSVSGGFGFGWTGKVLSFI